MCLVLALALHARQIMPNAHYGAFEIQSPARPILCTLVALRDHEGDPLTVRHHVLRRPVGVDWNAEDDWDVRVCPRVG